MRLKSFSILLICLMNTFSFAHADNLKCYVNIHQKSGGIVSFTFDDKPVVTMSGNNVVMTTTKATVEYPISNVEKMTVEKKEETTTILASSIALNESEVTLKEGETVALTISFTPSNVTNKEVAWTSSNTTVATVSNSGVVSAIKAGTSTISAKTTDGSNLSATCKVTVKIKGFELADGEPYTNTRRSTYDAVTFLKTFSETNVGKWNALYVPISIDVTNHATDFDIAEIYAFCSTVDTNGDGTVDANDERFLFVRPLTSGQTYPNTPYLIRPREAKNYIIKSADNILYEKREGKVEFSTTRDKFVVTGLNEEFTVVANDNNYYVSGSGKLSIRTSGSTTVKPNRWIMHREDKEYSNIPDYVDNNNHLDNDENTESGVKAYTIVAIGEDISEADAIQAVKNANGVFVKGIYTLDGRQIGNSYNLPAGVYIKNGKKVIIK